MDDFSNDAFPTLYTPFEKFILVALGVMFTIYLIEKYSCDQDQEVHEATRHSNRHQRVLDCLENPKVGDNLVGIPIEDIFIECTSQRNAYAEAKQMSGDREPLHHRFPHKDGELPHYHLQKHWYLINGNKLYNYHYTYQS